MHARKEHSMKIWQEMKQNPTKKEEKIPTSDDVVILRLVALNYSIDHSVGETVKDKGFFT